MPILSEYGISPESVLGHVRDSGLGQFGLSQLLGYLAINVEDVRIVRPPTVPLTKMAFQLLSENSMRVSGGGWELVSMCLQCLAMVAELLGITPSGWSSHIQDRAPIQRTSVSTSCWNSSLQWIIPSRICLPSRFNSSRGLGGKCRPRATRPRRSVCPRPVSSLRWAKWLASRSGRPSANSLHQ